MPNLTHVESSAIEAVGYDPVRRSLYLRFVNGGRYVYYGVPQEVHKDFMAAPSKGQFFAHHIRPVFTRYSEW
ncbi:KTSC domain-containing protein [Fimbriimonas ginsengisoli]|uniref:KTSC domain-containing protein n=1 Tax=Fimbriimonas ginsengisoli Gsoil 348 TaxID=661478 RepID=A0A068NKS4_FIMGI|nr:KTSC domain-containing protein [Fimbriimonas ginsengisoli]AIE83395.1 hypothetical protein OP10G_0027 [Fimbriimonas ginsengisoli Gsoil 348]